MHHTKLSCVMIWIDLWGTLLDEWDNYLTATCSVGVQTIAWNENWMYNCGLRCCRKTYCLQTRMHSSRMRTVRCSSRLLGDVCLPKGGGGCLPAKRVGGCTPPPCGQTDTCEKITFPQLLLRTVKMCTVKGTADTMNIITNRKVR